MSSWLRGWATVVAILLLGTGAMHAAVEPAPHAQLLGAPLRFEPNRGQTAAAVRFLARGTGYAMFLTDSEAVLHMDAAAVGATGEDAAPAVLRMRLVDAAAVRPRGRDRQSGVSNYVALDGGRAEVRDLPHYSELLYRQRYPGVDVVYYGNQGLLEYDFVLAPGADPAPIALAFEGAERLAIAANGDLNIEIGGRTLVQRAPVAYQHAAAGADATRLRHTPGRRIAISSRYRIDAAGQVRFELGDYDRTRALVIDPVISYGSYLGGADADGINDVARGSDGSLYLTGYTYSLDFPTQNPIHGNLGAREAFVTKLDPSGSALVFSTYIGGPGNQKGNAIEVDPQARPVICGTTEPPGTNPNAFVLRLNATGTLSYARTIVTANMDECRDLALDGEQAVAVGYTFADNEFPRVNPVATWNSAGGDAPFLVRYDTSGTLVQATLLPNHANSNDDAYGVAVKDGFAYVTGHWSPNGDQGNRQAFVIKLDADATFPESGEYLRSFGGSVDGGGSNGLGAFDGGRAIAVDASGRAFVAGSTYTSNFPVSVDAFQSSYDGGGDAFIARLSAAGNVIFASYLHWNGASGFSEVPNRIAFDPVNTLYVVGDLSGAFIARLPNYATQLDYLQPIRAFFLEAGAVTGVALAGVATPIIVGGDAGERFPVTAGAVQTNWANSGDGYLMRLEERLPVISIQGAVLSESSGCTDLAVHTDLAATTTVRFNWSAQNGSAIAGLDFNAGGGTDIGIEPGSVNANVNVGVCVTNDGIDEPDETFTVTLSGVTGASVGSAVATITIVDDDAPPSLAVDNGGCSVVEGNSGSVNCNFVARLSAASGRPVTFNTATANGSASAGSDYTGHASTARSIAAGQTTLTIAVPVLGDTLDEINESFLLNISGVTNATPGSLSATGTINDDDAVPTLTIDNAGCAVTEGNSGSVNCNFVARLSAASGRSVSFNSATANGTATAGADYTAHASTARSIAAGQTTLTIAVPVLGDTLDEDNESFALNLSGVANATPGTLAGTGTITDDDAAPTLTIDNGGCSVTEGNSGSVNCSFVARLSAASSRNISFNSATANGTATAGADFTAHASTARSIAAGQTALTIAVPVIGDTLDEDNESFALNLSGVANATPGSLSGSGTITDDDAAPTLTIDNGGCSVTEGNSGSVNCGFVARLSALSGRAVSFTTATANGTATAGSDYTGHGGVVRTINPGLQTLSVLVPVLGDTLDEPNESFALNLTAVANASPGALSGTGTIVDDDEPVATGSLRMRDATVQVAENAGSVQLVVERSGGSSGSASVNYATGNGSALAGLDYGAASGTLTWASGDAGSKTITLTIINDPAVEPQESFTVTLSQAGGAALGTPAVTTVTIIDGAQLLHANGFE